MKLRGRLSAWLLGRLQPAASWTLTQRNVYILPTAAGWAFAAMLLVMLVGSINYQLSLGFGLTFLLAGCGVVSMHLTHRTLVGLTLHLRPVAPVHAGQAATVEVVLANRAGVRESVGLRFHEAGPRQGPAAGPGRGQPRAWTQVPAQGQAVALLRFTPAARGLHDVPPVVVDTRFPFGFFRAWSVWRPAAQVLAWPVPETPAPPLPGRAAGDGRQANPRPGGGSELDGVRAWRRGDTLRQVVWKKAARTGELVSRQTAGAESAEQWLEWRTAQAGRGGAEERLSRLAAWVGLADRLGVPVGLRLPGVECPPGLGDAHRRRLLEALALWR